ncbi:MAG: hypothetical protein KDK40_01030 [Chlamydiia bacterium]|nr:hypothetical protein [Chlamydiia bacterium]
MEINPLTTDPCHVIVQWIDDFDTLASLKQVCCKARVCVNRRIAQDLDRLNKFSFGTDLSLMESIHTFKLLSDPNLIAICGLINRIWAEAKREKFAFLKESPAIHCYLPFVQRVKSKIARWEALNISMCHNSAHEPHAFPLRTSDDLQMLTSLTLNEHIRNSYATLADFFPSMSQLNTLSIALAEHTLEVLNFSTLSSLTSLELINAPINEKSVLPLHLKKLCYVPNDYSMHPHPLALCGHAKLERIHLENLGGKITLETLPKLCIVTVRNILNLSLNGLPELSKVTIIFPVPKWPAYSIREALKLTRIDFIPDSGYCPFSSLLLHNTPQLTSIPSTIAVSNRLAITGSCGLRRISFMGVSQRSTVVLPKKMRRILQPATSSDTEFPRWSSFFNNSERISSYLTPQSDLTQLSKFYKLTKLKLRTLEKCLRPQGALDFLRQLTRLKTLSLQEFTIQGGFPQAICTLTKLEHLDLWGSTFSELEGGSYELPNALTSLRRLETLDLSQTGFRGSFKILAKLKSLCILNLSNNHQPELTGDLLKMTQLKRLNLRSCQYEAIPCRDLLIKIPKSVIIDLTHNPILAFKSKWFYIDLERPLARLTH